MIEPAYLSIPPRIGSFGDEAVDLARAAGLDPDHEQCAAIEAILSYGRGGKWVAREAAIIEARQCGKTTNVLLPVTLYDLFLGEPDEIMWTAHLFRTSRSSFKDFCRCIDTSSALSRRVKKIGYSHGEESIELHPRRDKPGESGSMLNFMARERGGGRGLGGKRVIFDEALILSADAMDALMPTLSARLNAQLLYGSSAAKENSDHLHKLIKRGRSGTDPSLIWIEYCAPGSWIQPGCGQGSQCPHTMGTPGCALDNEELWSLASHTIGCDRMPYDNIRDERRSLSPHGFGRERLGWHEEPIGAGGAIDLDQWVKLRDVDSRRQGDIALAVDIAPTRDYAAIAMFGAREDGQGHLQLLDYRPGTEWVVDRLVELVATLDPIAIAMGKGTGASLETDLAKVDLTPPENPDEPKRGDVAVANATEMSAACGQIIDAVRQGTFHHLSQQPLDAAVAGSKTRLLMDSIAWTRKNADADISPLVAATLARWIYEAWAHLIAEDYDVMESVH